VRFSGTLVGHEPIEEVLMIPRMHPACEDKRLALRPLVSDWGAVAINYANSLERRPADRIRPFGEVRFYSIDGGFTFTQTIANFQTMDLPRIPAGSYIVTLFTEAGYTNFPAQEKRIEVTSGLAATVTFDLSLSCSIELALLAGEAKEYEGDTSFKIEPHTDDGPSGAFASFSRPPYRIDGLVPGNYRVRIYKPYQLGESLTIEVGAAAREATAVFEQP
jgi:hypothetical protein